MTRPLAIIAIGGNSLIKQRDKQRVEDQYIALCETMNHVADVIELGWQVVITHGNGPQVGFIMLRSEIARTVAGLHIVPLASCVADTQGAIGYQIQQALDNILRERSLIDTTSATLTIVTQVEVDANDPRLANPTKFIGEAYTEKQLPDLQKQHPDWILKKDCNRGWRRVVASPAPLRIIELNAIRTLLNAQYNVVAAGGGGIPVINTPQGLISLNAVIDKDATSCLLGNALGAKLLAISTSVEHVTLHYGTPQEQALKLVQVDELKRYYNEGHFPDGSMGPKIQAAIDFLRKGGERVIITSPEYLSDALTHGRGTHIIN